jgi:hypothetical protein
MVIIQLKWLRFHKGNLIFIGVGFALLGIGLGLLRTGKLVGVAFFPLLIIGFPMVFLGLVRILMGKKEDED